MYKQEKYYYKRAFFYAFLMACLLFLPFVIIDGGYFVYYGDFNAQQIPFYKTCIRAVQEGNLGWNWQTDLGVNFVGSYSFYTLGSPFFWLAALLPVGISQYLMAPLLALKLALSSLFAFIYIRRFVTKPQSALIGGILYAFSGYSLYNIFFNHFHEAIVFFPLLLIGLEECVVNKRRGALALAVAINAFVNYFFFIGECVFLVIYFIARIATSREFRISVGDFFCLAFESIVGVAIAGALFIPSIFQVLDVPRSTNILMDGGFMFYSNEQRYGLILEAMFFPPEVPARTNMFTGANAKWSSVALYLPLFSMAGVLAFFKGARKHWAKALLVVCLVMAFVPGLNASFTMFNNNFYTRWFYMPELICCLATVHALEDERCDFKFGIKFCSVAAGVMALIVLLHPSKKEYTVMDGDVETKVEKVLPNIMHLDIAPSVYVQIVITAVFLLLLGLMLKERNRQGTAHFLRAVLVTTVVCSMLLGYYFVGYGRILGPYVGNYNRAVSADIDIDDDSFYRMEAVDEINNVNMLWGKSSLKSFTSIIPSATFELYELLGITRDVNSSPDHDRYALRALTGVKYLIVRDGYDEEKLETALDDLRTFSYHSEQDGYHVYENEYVLPMGFAYDNYVTLSTAKSVSLADNLMCRAVVLTDEQAERYSDILTEISSQAARDSSFVQFEQDAADRIAAGVKDFTVTGTGFTAHTDYESDELVVFSVPYDRGWSAAVNGTACEVEKVNGGFVAVRVGAGAADIVFTYETPGAKYGLLATAGGAGLLAVYLLFQYVIMKRRPRRYVHLYQNTQKACVRAHRSYVNQLSRRIENAPEKGSVRFPENVVDEEEALQLLEEFQRSEDEKTEDQG